jgi:PleD family two-component response regulator
MPETASVEVEDKIKLVRNSLLAAMESNNWPATFSFGIAVFLDSVYQPDEMLTMADALMYRAKQSGKNCVVTEIYI